MQGFTCLHVRVEEAMVFTRLGKEVDTCIDFLFNLCRRDQETGSTP